MLLGQASSSLKSGAAGEHLDYEGAVSHGPKLCGRYRKRHWVDWENPNRVPCSERTRAWTNNEDAPFANNQRWPVRHPGAAAIDLHVRPFRGYATLRRSSQYHPSSGTPLRRLASQGEPRPAKWRNHV